MIKIIPIAALTIVLYFPAGISAQADDQKDLTVREAINYAVDNEPSLNRLSSQIEAQKASRLPSLGIQDPQLLFFREGIDGGTFTEQRWQFIQNFDLPLSYVYRYRRADAKYEALLKQYESARLQLKARVKSAYTNVAYATEILNLRRRQVDIAEEIERIANERTLAGQSSKIDVLQAEIRRSEAYNNYYDAVKELQNSRYRLFNTIGLSPEDQTYDIIFPDTLQYKEVDISQPEVLGSVSDIPDLMVQQELIRSAENDLKLSRSGFLPSFSASYYYQDYSGGYDFRGFQFTVSVPLWFAVKQSKNVARSRNMLKAQQLGKIKQQMDLKTNAEQAYHSYESGKIRIENYIENIRGQSEELLALTQEAYRVGETPLINYLEAQRTYLQSQEGYLTALKDYYMQLIELEKIVQEDIVYVD